MRVVWKYPLAIADEQTIDLPAEATPLHVGLDPVGQPCLWAMVDPDASKVAWTVRVVGTGNPTTVSARSYVGSFVQRPFIWHVFADAAEADR